MIQFHTHTGNVTTHLKGKIYLIRPELIVTKIMTWNCRVDASARGRYDIILVRYILTALVVNIKLSEHVIKADYGNFKGSTSPMDYLGT